MRLLLATLLTLTALRSLATTFTVTTNADSGPGSLRDAINQAGASGGGPNLINFAIADQTRAGRTITLASTLPNLPANTTIDGTSQPGIPFGISKAGIIITDISPTDHFYYFFIHGVDNIQIYGLFLQSISYYIGVDILQCNNVNIGAPGKGNIFQGFQTAIIFDNSTEEPFTTKNLSVQGNIMGTDESGTSASAAQLNGIDIWTLDVTNLQIGGLNPGEGNLMNQTLQPLEYSTIDYLDYGYLNIQGNMEGVDLTGNTRLSPNNQPFLIANNWNTGKCPLVVNITNNVSVGGYELIDIFNPFVIQGNHIGVGLDNITNLISGAANVNGDNISLNNCSQGLIGGSGAGQMNYIANNVQGVVEERCGPITISRNSFFCNGTGIIPDPANYPHPAPFANITLLNTGTVGGTALPNCLIELFYDDICPGCEGKTYIGNTTADASGNWSYTLPATGAIVVTGTDIYGGTSAFSTATINTDNLVVTNATCGRKNGSVKNIKVMSGTEWQWQDANGNIVSTNTDLTNVGPGTYTFVTSIGGEACNATSKPYTITDVILPAFDPASITTTQPSCGQNTGALAYSGTFDPATNYSWVNAAGTTVCSDFSAADPLANLPPGTYTLQLVLTQDATCTTQYGPYTLKNQAGPIMKTAGANITPATCGLANGSITGITCQNLTPPLYLLWRNAEGVGFSPQPVQPDLDNARPDSYQLVLKDGSGCVDTIFSPWYTIPDNGAITYDTTKLIYTQSTCDQPNGALTGITTTGATTFTWTNTGTGNVVGSAIDASALAPGVYQLSLSDAYGCQLAIPTFTIRQIPLPAFDYIALQQNNDTCNAGIGSIKDLAMADSTRGYTWTWYDASNANPVATTAGYLDNLHAGSYFATVADQYACPVTSKPVTITDVELSPPMPQVAGAYIARNTSTVITVTNPPTGEYFLLDGPSFGATILDSSASGILQTPVVPQDETLYVGFVRGDCSSPIAPVNIKVFDSVRIFVPNAFTPNGDGANDYWRLIIQGLTKKIRVSVYDRWGAMVFSSNDPNMSWDGTASGRQLSGTFVYLIAGTDYYNKPFLLKGTLMIIR